MRIGAGVRLRWRIYTDSWMMLVVGLFLRVGLWSFAPAFNMELGALPSRLAEGAELSSLG